MDSSFCHRQTKHSLPMDLMTDITSPVQFIEYKKKTAYRMEQNNNFPSAHFHLSCF